MTTTDVMEDGEFTVTDEDTTLTTPVADLKWSLSGADASKFDISTTGSETRTLSLQARTRTRTRLRGSRRFWQRQRV